MIIENKERTACFYSTSKGFSPIYFYLENLADKTAQAKIRMKINRAEKGNFGSKNIGYKYLTSGVWELKIHYRPGFRVYFSLQGDVILLLLCAGSKKTQFKDIKRAQSYLKDYKEKFK